MPDEQTPRSGLERHVQTVAAALIIGLMSWVGISVNELTGQMVRFEEKLSASQNLSAQRDVRIQRLENTSQDLLLRVDRLERHQ